MKNKVILIRKYTVQDCRTGNIQKFSLSQVRSSETWIASKYERNWFIGRIEEVHENDGEAYVNFMERSKERSHQLNFMWPEREDILWVKREDILCVIEPPSQSSKTHRTFQLSAATMELIEERFRSSFV